MKKITSLSLSLAFALASSAQITITSADMPNVNDSLFVSNALSWGDHHPQETGANYNWDYSDLKCVFQQPQEFVRPGKFPSLYNLLFNQFNTSYGKDNPLLSSIDVAGIKVEAAYDFYKETTSYFSQIGAGYLINGVPLPFVYNRPDVLYRFPLNYKNTYSGDFNFGLEVPGYGYYGQKGYRENVVDGWGQLKTPLGTYNTLRIFSTVNVTDTVYSEGDSLGLSVKRPTKYEYKWFAANSKIPVLQIDGIIISNQLVYTATYVDTLRKVINVGIDGNSNDPLSLKVYPNPAQDQFIVDYQLTGNSQVKISLTDMLGREVMPLTNEMQQAGTHQQSVNITGIPAGIYFVNLQSNNVRVVKKLSIVN